MGMLTKANLALQNYPFKRWRLHHPQATLKDYFAVIAKDDLARGRQYAPQDAFVDYG